MTLPHRSLRNRLPDALHARHAPGTGRTWRVWACALPVVAALAGCAVAPPSGPSIMALPPRGADLNAFQQQDYSCRDYAFRSTDTTSASNAATSNGVASAVVGTLAGAAVGALLSGPGPHSGAGVALGAGAGLAVGSAVGAGQAQDTAGNLQARYDTAYAQCMTAAGNTIAQPGPRYIQAPPVYYGPVYGPMYGPVYGPGRRW